MTYEVLINGVTYRVELRRGDAVVAGQQWICRVNGRELRVDSVQPQPGSLSLLIGGAAYEFERDMASETELRLLSRGQQYVAEVRDPRALRSRRARAAQAEGPRRLLAPMPGKIVRVLAPAGARVEAGGGVLVIEAMKMQNEIKSPKAGVVKKVLAGEGAAVNAGDVLAVVE